MYFIRYADPDNHLRVRFQVQNSKYAKLLAVWHRTLKPYVQSGQVKRVILDTYDRELERYRPTLIEYCETIFNADSQFVLNWLGLVDQQAEAERYKLALLSTDALLSDFSFSLSDKVRFSKQLQQRFFQEQNGTKELKQSLNALYRDRHKAFFERSPAIIQFITERSHSVRSSIESIQSYFARTPADKGYDQLVASLIHMAMNRIFQGQLRRHEMVVYHFMARHYESGVALAKKDSES